VARLFENCSITCNRRITGAKQSANHPNGSLHARFNRSSERRPNLIIFTKVSTCYRMAGVSKATIFLISRHLISWVVWKQECTVQSGSIL